MSDDRGVLVRRGSGDGMGAKESCRNTGSPGKQSGKAQRGNPRGTGLACEGGGEARRSEDARNERRAKGPQFQGNAPSGARVEIDASLAPPDKLWKLQETLHAKAKGKPNYRFYSLYDKLYRPDVLAEAWRRCRANAGAAGVDGVSFASIEAQGVAVWLGQLAQSLKDKRVVCVKFCKKESGMLRNVGKLFGRHRESAYVAGRRCRCEQLPGKVHAAWLLRLIVSLRCSFKVSMLR